MIARLKELRLRNFRRFNGRGTVPLDGDIVIIYGPNGTGKSSVLNGIEFSLTGRVRDLEIYADDYPRSLRHATAGADAEASVTFLSDEEEQTSTYRVDERDAVIGESAVTPDN